MLERLYPLGSMMTVIEDAVIVAGGLGSRMLPNSAYLPKEAIPLVDIPSMIHLIREAASAGAKRIHLITSPSKDFSSFSNDKSDFLNLRPEISKELFNPMDGLEYHVHVQKEPLGLGHALMQSLNSINGPFLVLLGDNILLNNFNGINDYKPSDASKKLVEQFTKTGLPCAGLCAVSQDEVSNYGVVRILDGKIIDIVEKPKSSEAPSNLVLCGRYIFTSDSQDLLENRFTVEKYGELQSIELQKHWMNEPGFVGVELSDYQWYDSGNPFSWLKAQIDYALRNDNYSSELIEWLSQRLNQ